MRFCLLGSGSKGNCLWIEEDRKAAVIDNGLSCSEFLVRARAAGLEPGLLRHVVVSHEHTDHLSGVGPLARKFDATVHMTELAAEKASAGVGRVRLKTFKPGDRLDLGPVSLTAMTSSHDTVDPVVFVARGRKVSLGAVTDLGAVTHLIREGLRNLDALVLEFNHDVGRLLSGPYPEFLKQRVRGRRGHLSNEQAGELLRELNHPGLRLVVLAHISETNNTPELAMAAALAALEGAEYSPVLLAAGQWQPTEIFEL
jgi:phosphoribosyl 1,2-cyclic phosphodiesterase